MKKHKIIITMILMCVLLFGSVITTHAAISADYYNATYYLELPDGKRFMSQYSLKWGTSPIYINVIDDYMIMFCEKGLYLTESNGNYDVFGGCEKITYTFGGKEWNGYKYSYPFTLGGVTVNNSSEVVTKISTSGDFKGVVYRVYDGHSISEAQDFFKNPLVVAVENCQGIATAQIVMLIPICLALLVGYLGLRKALSILQTILHRA